MRLIKHISLLIFICTSISYGQTEDKIEFNAGVDQYREGEYEKAQERFEAAYQQNTKNTRALYNAGNAAYLRGDFEAAKSYYEQYAQLTNNDREIAKAYFNNGNASLHKADQLSADPSKLQEGQMHYKEAIKSFKSSLKYDPNDLEAKYNLTYALKKLQENQQQQQEQQQNQDQDQNQDQKDKNQDGGNQGDNKDGEGDQQENNDDPQNDDKNQNGDNGDEKEEKDGDDQKDSNGDKGDQEEEKEKDQSGQGEQKDNKEQPVEGQISKAQAEKDLDAINNDESKILQKVYGKKGDKKVETSSGKDW